jgi:hypothetical protein
MGFNEGHFLMFTVPNPLSFIYLVEVFSCQIGGKLIDFVIMYVNMYNIHTIIIKNHTQKERRRYGGGQ